MLPRTIILAAAIISCQLSSVDALYKVPVALRMDYVLEEYHKALGGKLINAAQYKTVTLNVGEECDASENYCFGNLAQIETGPAPDSHPCTDSVQCSPSCVNQLDFSTLTPITTSNNLDLLSTGQNVAVNVSAGGGNYTSYVLSLEALM